METDNLPNKPILGFEPIFKKALEYLPILGVLTAILYGAYKIAIYSFVFVYLMAMGVPWLLSISNIEYFFSGNFSVIAILGIVTCISLVMIPLEAESDVKFKKYMKFKILFTYSVTGILFLYVSYCGFYKPEMLAKSRPILSAVMWTIFSVLICSALFDLPYLNFRFRRNLKINKIKFIIVNSVLFPMVIIIQSGIMKGRDDMYLTSTSLPIIKLKNSPDTYGALLIHDDNYYITKLDTLVEKKFQLNKLFPKRKLIDGKVKIVSKDSVEYILRQVEILTNQ